MRNDFVYKRDLLLKSDRIAIPMALQRNVLNSIHDVHLNIKKCRARSLSVWWPGMSRNIEFYVKNCSLCAQHQINYTEP